MRKSKDFSCFSARPRCAGLTAVLAAAETDGWQLTLGPTNPDLTEETDNDQYSNEAPL